MLGGNSVKYNKKNNRQGYAAFALTILMISVFLGCQSTGNVILKVKNMVEVQGQYDQAIQVLKKELEDNPDSAATWYWLGVSYSRKFQFKEAASALEQAFARNLYQTYHPSAYDYLGMAYLSTGQYKKAADACTQALILNPKNANALVNRARARNSLGEYSAAIADSTQALFIYHDDVFAKSTRAFAYYKTRQYGFALKDYDAIISKESPPWSSSLTGRGWTYYMMGEFEKAIADFDAALKYLSPNDRISKRDAYRGKAFAALALGQDKAATPLIDKAKEVPGYDPRKDLALIYHVLGDKEKAREYGGRKAYIGVEVKDYADSTIKGVQIVKAVLGGPAEKAGLLAGDIIVSIDGHPVSTVKDVAGKILQKSSGQTAMVTIVKKGMLQTRVRHEVKVVSVELFFDKDPLIAHVIEHRKTLTAAIQTSESPVKEAPVTSESDKDKGQADVQETSVMPVIEIDSLRVIPEQVPPGSRFKIKIDLYAENPAEPKSKMEVTLNYSISKGGKVLKRFKPQKFRVPNGEPTTITKKTRATKKKGEYTVAVELAFEDKEAKRSADFSIE